MGDRMKGSIGGWEDTRMVRWMEGQVSGRLAASIA